MAKNVPTGFVPIVRKEDRIFKGSNEYRANAHGEKFRVSVGGPICEWVDKLKGQRPRESPLHLPKPIASASAPVTVANLDGYLMLFNISCVDADGNMTERYDRLYFSKDVERLGREISHFTPYEAASHFERNKSFLPSYALTCNTLAALYPAAVRKEADGTYTTLDAEVKKVLDQYNNNSVGYGYQAQNTILNFVTEEVIHYPTAADFNQTETVNANHLRIARNFTKTTTLQDCFLENALKDAALTRNVKQLTGLIKPEILVEIGKYFGRPAILWFPWNGRSGAAVTDKQAAWFGCDSGYLNLVGNVSLNLSSAARGVRLGTP